MLLWRVGLLLPFCCVVNVNVPQFFDQLIYLWAHRLLPVFGYCKLCCYENCGAYVLLNWCFRILRVYSQHWICQLQKQFHFCFFEKIPYCFPQSPFLHNLSSTCCLLTCLWWPFWPVWSGISVWVFFFILVLICISLMASAADHPFICIWARYMSSQGVTSFHLFSFSLSDASSA